MLVDLDTEGGCGRLCGRTQEGGLREMVEADAL